MVSRPFSAMQNQKNSSSHNHGECWLGENENEGNVFTEMTSQDGYSLKKL